MLGVEGRNAKVAHFAVTAIPNVGISCRDEGQRVCKARLCKELLNNPNQTGSEREQEALQSLKMLNHGCVKNRQPELDQSEHA